MKNTILIGIAMAMTVPLWAATVVDTFESSTDSWSGDGVLATETPTQPAYGYPYTGDHTQTLAVSGEVCRVTADVNVFDMMVKIDWPDEHPSTPSDDALFAFAAETNGTLLAYCKATISGDAAYVSLGDAVYASNSWVRLTVSVETTEKSFIVATNGVLTGSTYYLAIEPSESIVTNVSVSGSTAIDDFVAMSATVTSTTYDPYAAVSDTSGTAAATASDVVDASGNTVSVPSNYWTANSISTSVGVNESAGAANLTIAQAYLAGVDPKTGTFTIEDATFDGTTLTLVFPGSWPAGTYKVKYGTTSDCSSTASFSSAAKDGDANTATISMSGMDSSNVLYCKMTR